MTDATDDFNRANGGLGTNWTDSTGATLQIVSNLVIAGSSFSHCVAYWNADAFNDDQYSQVTIANVAQYNGVWVRHQSGSLSGYVAYFDGGGCTIYRVDSGSFTQLANSAAQTFATNDVARLTITGSSLSLTRNGSEVLTATDSTYTSGQPGINVYDNGGTPAIDDWVGGPIAGGTTASGDLSSSGSGSLSATAAIDALASGTSAGAGSLSGSGASTASGNASAAGTATLSAPALAQASGDVSAAGAGTLAGAAEQRASGGVTASGSATVSATGEAVAVATGAMDGVGALTAIGDSGSALTASGQASASFAATIFVSAALSASGAGDIIGASSGAGGVDSSPDVAHIAGGGVPSPYAEMLLAKARAKKKREKRIYYLDVDPESPLGNKHLSDRSMDMIKMGPLSKSEAAQLEQELQAEQDMRTILEAEKIRSDPSRLKRVEAQIKKARETLDKLTG